MSPRRRPDGTDGIVSGEGRVVLRGVKRVSEKKSDACLALTRPNVGFTVCGNCVLCIPVKFVTEMMITTTDQQGVAGMFWLMLMQNPLCLRFVYICCTVNCDVLCTEHQHKVISHFCVSKMEKKCCILLHLLVTFSK